MKFKFKHILLLALGLRLVFAFIAWHPDLNNHVDWGIRFFEYGPTGFYAPDANVWSYTWPNQPPGTILLFAGIRKLYEFLFSVVWWINVNVSFFPSGVMPFFEHNFYEGLLKLPSILADLGIGLLLYRFFKDLKKPKAGVLAASVFLFNPVIWYNSSIWGQTDAVINFLCLAGLFLLIKRKITFAFILLAICLYVKISLAIFVPLFIVIAIKQKYRSQDYVGAITLPLVIILTITLLFSGQEDPISWLINLYDKKILTQQLQVITANAFNIWATIAGIHERPHTLLLGPLSYQWWGNIFFGGFYIYLLYKLWKNQKPLNVIWIFALTAFSSWMLMTNMHERYLYPLFPYFAILAVYYKSLITAYWLVSGVNLLNLYNFWFTPRIEPIVNFLSLGDRIMPRILGVVNFGLLIYLVSFYQKVFVKAKN